MKRLILCITVIAALGMGTMSVSANEITVSGVGSCNGTWAASYRVIGGNDIPNRVVWSPAQSGAFSGATSVTVSAIAYFTGHGGPDYDSTASTVIHAATGCVEPTRGVPPTVAPTATKGSATSTPTTIPATATSVPSTTPTAIATSPTSSPSLTATTPAPTSSPATSTVASAPQPTKSQPSTATPIRVISIGLPPYQPEAPVVQQPLPNGGPPWTTSIPAPPTSRSPSVPSAPTVPSASPTSPPVSPALIVSTAAMPTATRSTPVALPGTVPTTPRVVTSSGQTFVAQPTTGHASNDYRLPALLAAALALILAGMGLFAHKAR